MADKIDILITKFLSGNTTEEESLQLQNWRHSESANETYFMTFEAAWKSAGNKAATNEKDVDIDWAWADLQERIGERTDKKPLFAPIRIAAGILLLVFLSVVIALVFTDTTEKPPVVAMQKIPTTVDTDMKKLSIPDTFVVNGVAEPE